MDFENRLQLNVMFIEDNQHMSELLQVTLESMNLNYKVEVITSGEKALEILKKDESSYDIIVVDYILPGMNGLEFLDRLKKGSFNIASVFFTGKGSETIAVEALKRGASDYVVKDSAGFKILPTILERVYKQKQLENYNMELQKRIVQQNRILAEANQNLMSSSKELIKAKRTANLLFFVREISHELNNPLAGLVGFSELLLNRLEPQSPIRDDLEEVRASAYRIKNVVSKLAKFCGTEKRKVRVINVHEAINDVLAFFQPRADETSINIEKHFCDDGSANVKMSVVDLEQAVMAILMNCRRAMPDGGNLKIATQVFDNILEISITDSGGEISEENLEKIFSPFFQANQKEKIIGMDLAVTYGIIKENNGEITVHSEKGRGATYTISLPVAGE
ncbi:MAG: response regulator [Vulcanimicrobiota bacterium]